MPKITADQKNKLKAGLSLLCESNTSIDGFQKLAKLIKGFNPTLDQKLAATSEILEKIKQVSEGDIIGLSTDKLPEKTEKQRKYKKYLLLFIVSLKDLKSEIIRVGDLQSALASSGASGANAVKTSKIALTAKGPLGTVTLAAVGVVAVTAFLSTKIVTVNVTNEGCSPIEPMTEQKINLPGLKLPSTPIGSGDQDKVVMPGLDFTLDWTQGNSISLSAMNLSRNYDLGYDVSDIVLNGQSLAGKNTEIKLSQSKTHEVIVKCE